MGTRLWYAMWDANEDDDAAFERRANPMLREIGDRCKVVAVEAGQRPHEPTPAPSPAPTRQVAQAQTPGVGAPHSSTSSSHSHQQGEKTAVKGSRAVTTVQQLMPSTASSTTSGSFAEMAAFIREEHAFRESQRQEWEAKLDALIREERAFRESQRQELEAQRQQSEAKLEKQRQEWEVKLEALIREERAFRETQRQQSEAKLEQQRQEWEAKLEAQRQEWEAKLEAKQMDFESKLDAQKEAYETKLEAQRQETERQDAKMCVSDAKLEGLQERFDALRQAKLLTDDEVLVLENKIADFIDRRSSAMVAPADIGVVAESVRKLVGMCEGVSRDGMLARQLRQRYL